MKAKSACGHTGSSVDSFLAEEGILDEFAAVAVKRVIVWQLSDELQNHSEYLETSGSNEPCDV